MGMCLSVICHRISCLNKPWIRIAPSHKYNRHVPVIVLLASKGDLGLKKIGKLGSLQATSEPLLLIVVPEVAGIYAQLYAGRVCEGNGDGLLQADLQLPAVGSLFRVSFL